MSGVQQKMKVLVVDDTATNRQILQVFLTKLGFDVVLAKDGAEGVAAFEGEAPDLVIMDVMMPVMDGYEATRRIKALSGERWVPVVFLSALDKEENLVAGLDAGGDDYLHKPVNFVVLDAKLRSLVRAIGLQRSLDEERRLVKAMSDNLVDGVVMIDVRGTVLWCNSAIGAIFGYRPDELVGRNVSELMPEPHRAAHDGYLRRYVEGGQPRVIGLGQRELTGRRRGGEEFPVELGVSEMHFGGERRFIGVLRDISERAAVQRQLRDNAERLQAYHDAQESENALAQRIVSRQMQRAGLNDPRVRYWLEPAANFSGDIVAALRGPGGDLYLLVADATGHGLGAAICTLPVLSVFYSMGETGVALSWIVHEVNRQLHDTLPVGYFVAATLVRVAADGRSGEAWVGGTPDLLQLGPDGRVKRRLASAHLPLGIDDVPAEQVVTEPLDLAAGDQLALFTDGLLEAAGSGPAFGYDRLAEAFASSPSPGRLAAVKASLDAHLGQAEHHDDVSLMLVDC